MYKLQKDNAKLRSECKALEAKLAKSVGASGSIDKMKDAYSQLEKKYEETEQRLGTKIESLQSKLKAATAASQ